MDSWDDLRVFLAVAELGSLSTAGQALRIDPATVGRRIKRLEAKHSTALFAKSPKGYVLTDAGTGLMQHVAQARSALDAGLGHLGETGAELSGQIRIGAPDGNANFLLPQVCVQISRQFPDLEIQIVALPRVFNLTRREADMAIGVSRPTASRLMVDKIADYRLHLAGAASFLAQNDPIEKLRDLQTLPIVGYIPDMIFDKELDYLDSLKLARVHLASNSVSVQLNLLRQGTGVGVVHDFALPFAPELERILVDQLSLTRSFYLIRSHDDKDNRRLNWFADILIQAMRDEIARLERQVI